MKIQISALDRETLEIADRSTKATSAPRRRRRPQPPSEQRAVVTQMVRRLSSTQKANAIHSAISHKVMQINADRSLGHRLQKPSRGMVKTILLEHRRSVAMAIPTDRPGSSGSDEHNT